MTTQTIEQIKQKEVLYLIIFLIQLRIKPTILRTQATLREAVGLRRSGSPKEAWSITAADIETYWPANLPGSGEPEVMVK